MEGGFRIGARGVRRGRGRYRVRARADAARCGLHAAGLPITHDSAEARGSCT